MKKLTSGNTGYDGINIVEEGNMVLLKLVIPGVNIENILITDNDSYSEYMFHTTYEYALLILLKSRAVWGDGYIVPIDDEIDFDTGINYIKEHNLNVLGVSLDSEPETLGDIIKPHIKSQTVDDTNTEIQNLEDELNALNGRSGEVERRLDLLRKKSQQDEVAKTINSLKHAEDKRNSKLATASEALENLVSEYKDLISALEEEHSVCTASAGVLTNAEHISVVNTTININTELVSDVNATINVNAELAAKLNEYISKVITVNETYSKIRINNDNSSNVNNADVKKQNDDMLCSFEGLHIQDFEAMLNRLSNRLLDLNIKLSNDGIPTVGNVEYESVLKRIKAVKNVISSFYN